MKKSYISSYTYINIYKKLYIYEKALPVKLFIAGNASARAPAVR